jgi:hypothetical protein
MSAADSDINTKYGTPGSPTSNVLSQGNRRKRKAETSLSTNPHTVKARKRIEAIKADPLRLQVEKAKAADQGAITYAKKKLLATEAYIQAAAEEKKAMIKKSALEVQVKRYFSPDLFKLLY